VRSALIHLLLRPLQRVRFLLIPGVVIVAMFVNVPIISQSSTAVAVGTVLVPVLQAARLSPVTIAAALALGASIGGELLNPGAPELRTITSATGATSGECVARIWPLLLVHVVVALPIFWWMCARAERKSEPTASSEPIRDDFRVNWFKAAVPLIPLLLLFVVASPEPIREAILRPWPGWMHERYPWLPNLLDLTRVPKSWVGGEDISSAIYDGRLVGLAMMTGVVIAALTSPGKVPQSAKVFFEGAGYALANITSLIVCANCFGEGVKGVGLADYLTWMVGQLPALLFPLASAFPLGFAWASGSGMASTQSLYDFFYNATGEQADPLRVGAVVSLSAAAGRTMSPVAAVVLLSASLVKADPLAMMRRMAPALIAGLIVVVIVAMWLG